MKKEHEEARNVIAHVFVLRNCWLDASPDVQGCNSWACLVKWPKFRSKTAAKHGGHGSS